MRRIIVVLAALLIAALLPATAHADDWWKPAKDAGTLHWALEGAIDPNNPKHVGERDLAGKTLPRPAVIDIDGEYNTAATVATLHSRGQKVICYFDAGVYENYRTDAHRFPKSVIGKKDGNWEGSFWLDIRQTAILLPIMEDRIKMCAAKGFDAVEPDEIDGWENVTGFPLTYAHQVTYNKAIAALAHKHGLGAVQKGDIIQVQDLVNDYDATLNEECAQYNECLNPYNPVTKKTQVGLQAYTQQNKAVWQAEYKAKVDAKLCKQAKAQGWWAARYKLGLPLNGGRKPC